MYTTSSCQPDNSTVRAGPYIIEYACAHPWTPPGSSASGYPTKASCSLCFKFSLAKPLVVWNGRRASLFLFTCSIATGSRPVFALRERCAYSPSPGGCSRSTARCPGLKTDRSATGRIILGIGALVFFLPSVGLRPNAWWGGSGYGPASPILCGTDKFLHVLYGNH